MTGALATNVTDIGTWACPSAKLILAADKAGQPEWYEIRRKGIGASDFAPIMNESPWANSTPYGVWLDKLENRQLDETPAMHWGTVLEDAIARDWAKVRGLQIRNVGTYQSRTHEHCLANPDRLVNDGGGLEVKTGNAFTKAWVDGAIPIQYQRQSEFCMAVTGRCHWWLVALLGGQKMEVRLVKREGCEETHQHVTVVTDEQLAAHLDFAEAWWQKHIVEFIPPEVGKPVELEPIDANSISDTPLPEMVLADHARWLEIKQEIKDLEEELEGIKERAAAEIGNAKRLRAAGRDVFRWVERKGSNRFLRAKFKKEHPELEAQYSEVGEPTRYISVIGGNDE